MQPARIKLHAKEHTNNPVQRPLTEANLGVLTRSQRMLMRSQWHLHIRAFIAFPHGVLPGVCKSATFLKVASSRQKLAGMCLAGSHFKGEDKRERVVYKRQTEEEIDEVNLLEKICMDAWGRVGELRNG
jgi:hypothetical protein